jgi:hypothetical protein
MMMTHTDYKSPNESLYLKIQEVYDMYFHPETDCREPYLIENCAVLSQNIIIE